MSEGERRLAAIMFTDMVGFTALTQSDEAQSLSVLERHNRLLRPIFPKFHGREVKTIGDSFLVEFDSALDAVNCAMEIQRFLHDYNVSSRDEWKITLRIGIHLGDVVRAGNDILGDAVNIASRLQPLAEPEGICVSDQVYGQVRNKIRQALSKLSPRDLKNVKYPVDAYRMVMPWEKEREEMVQQLDYRRIAVLPFANLSSDPEEGYFADGMTEELITTLSGVRQLTVIARTSIMQYKNSQKRASDIGRELNAGTLIEGSIRKAGNRVRITAQLIDATTEGHLWAQNYDRQMEDVFAIQSEIAQKVAGELSIRLVDSEKRIIEKKPTENTQAYSYFLQGRESLRGRSESSLRKAKELLEKAVASDPSFARAHSELAECIRLLGDHDYEPYLESIAKAKVPLGKALELDPNLAEAHVVFSRILFNEDKMADSEAEARRAIELNPSLPDAYASLASVAWLKHDIEEGIRLTEKYYSLDPIRPSYVEALGTMYFYLGREGEALEHWEKTVQLSPFGTYRLMTEYYLSKGNYEKAKELYLKAEKLNPTISWTTWMKGFIAGRTGDREGALLCARQIESKMGTNGLVYIGYVYYALGDFDSYFEYLNKALDAHTYELYPEYCPLFEKGRSDRRYQAVLEKAKKINWPEDA